MIEHCLVLGADLAGDGNELGPKTLLRLQKVLLYKAFCEKNRVEVSFVVAASFSPEFPDQKETMAKMMADWLRQNGCVNVVELRAETFNTIGELKVFYKHTDDNDAVFISVLTAPYHWRRMRHLIRREFRREFGRRSRLEKTCFVACERDRPTAKELFILEPLKLLLIYLPRSWRTGLVRLARVVGLKS